MESVNFMRIDSEEEAYINVIPERNLYAAILATAVSDLISGKPSARKRAILWFQGADAPIMFEDIKWLFDLREYRLSKIEDYINLPRYGKSIRRPRTPGGI